MKPFMHFFFFYSSGKRAYAVIKRSQSFFYLTFWEKQAFKSMAYTQRWGGKSRFFLTSLGSGSSREEEKTFLFFSLSPRSPSLLVSDSATQASNEGRRRRRTAIDVCRDPEIDYCRRVASLSSGDDARCGGGGGGQTRHPTNYFLLIMCRSLQARIFYQVCCKVFFSEVLVSK